MKKTHLFAPKFVGKNVVLKKKREGLGLVNLEATKTSLHCKWIVNAMQPSESNMKLMLLYRFSMFNLQRGRSWGTNLNWFTNKVHIGFLGSKVWGHIGKACKFMVKGTYQLLPRTLIELLHSNIWWSHSLQLIDNGFFYARAYELNWKGIQCVNDIRDIELCTFNLWHETQLNSNLPLMTMRIGLHSLPKFLTNGGISSKKIQMPPIHDNGCIVIVMGQKIRLCPTMCKWFNPLHTTSIGAIPTLNGWMPHISHPLEVS